MSDKLVLYHINLSPPARAVRVVAKLLDLDLDLREVNLFQGEQLKEPYIKLNPEHTVPTLDDNGFIIWDSQTICAYLVDKYAKDDKLYPKDLKLRAKCNQRLFFNASSLFVRVRDCGLPILRNGGTEVSQDKIDAINAAFDILEAFLATDPFLVGTNLTIADVCAAVSLPFLNVFVSLKADKHPKILAWLNRVNKTIPFFEEMNAKYAQEYGQLISGLIEKNKQKK